MGVESQGGTRLDLREILPIERSLQVMKIFNLLDPGQELQVVADHDPSHLLQQMKRQRLPVDDAAFEVLKNSDGSFVGIFRKLGNK